MTDAEREAAAREQAHGLLHGLEDVDSCRVGNVWAGRGRHLDLCDRVTARHLAHAVEVGRLRSALTDAVSACTGGPALSEERWSEIHALAGRTL